VDSDSHIYGLLGRIHVLMRRTINRITDVEYMRINADYARAIVHIGEATGHEELIDLCHKLRVAMDLDPPAAKAAAHPVEKKPLFAGLGHHKPDEDEDGDNRYIRTLR
jgi:hypothetical protein